jgi:hypothetical protein
MLFPTPVADEGYRAPAAAEHPVEPRSRGRVRPRLVDVADATGGAGVVCTGAGETSSTSSMRAFHAAARATVTTSACRHRSRCNGRPCVVGHTDTPGVAPQVSRTRPATAPTRAQRASDPSCPNRGARQLARRVRRGRPLAVNRARRWVRETGAGGCRLVRGGAVLPLAGRCRLLGLAGCHHSSNTGNSPTTARPSPPGDSPLIPDDHRPPSRGGRPPTLDNLAKLAPSISLSEIDVLRRAMMPSATSTSTSPTPAIRSKRC